MRLLAIIYLNSLAGCTVSDPNCMVPSATVLEATALLSPVYGTVLTVRWATTEPGTSRVEWGLDESYGVAVELEGTATTHAVAVAGLPPNEIIYWRVVSMVGDELQTSSGEQIESGAVPSNLPALRVEPEFESAVGQTPFLTANYGDGTSAHLFDRTGRSTWWLYSSDVMGTSNVKLSRDQTSILWMTQANNRESPVSNIRRISWDGETIEDTAVGVAHHDFVELPEGGYAFCTLDVREFEGNTIVGDAIAEIPRGGDPDTDLTVVWSSWDDIPVNVDAETDDGFYPQGLDWIHCNSLIYDEAEGAYYMSTASLDSLLKIDRARGELVWGLGGTTGDFELTAGDPFSTFHSPELTESGVRIFDNGEVSETSRVVEYALDEENFTAAEVWSYDAGNRYGTNVLGDAATMPDGNLQLSWGDDGVYQQINLEGEELWVGAMTVGNASGYVHPLVQMGGPVEE